MTTTRASGAIACTSWAEEPYREVEGGPKRARARAANALSGDVEGETTLEYRLAYLDEAAGTFTGFEHVVGRIGGRSGSFVLRHEGTFDGGAIEATLSVVPGSGTGELAGLRGEESFTARDGQQPPPNVFDRELR